MIKNILTITIGVLLLLTSNYLGHVYPPFSIMWTPVLIGVFTGLVLFITDFRLVVKFGLIVGLIISNDVLIKFFAGGTHDWEGVSWISLSCIFGLFISFILILIYGFRIQKQQKKKYYLYVIISSVYNFYLFSIQHFTKRKEKFKFSSTCSWRYSCVLCV